MKHFLQTKGFKIWEPTAQQKNWTNFVTIVNIRVLKQGTHTYRSHLDSVRSKKTKDIILSFCRVLSQEFKFPCFWDPFFPLLHYPPPRPPFFCFFLPPSPFCLTIPSLVSRKQEHEENKNTIVTPLRLLQFPVRKQIFEGGGK